VDTKRAKKLQEELKKKVRIVPLKKVITCVAGVDAAFFGDRGDRIIGAACLFKYPELTLIDIESKRLHSLTYPAFCLSGRALLSPKPLKD
jgi:deoxyinosine 3'endonuclease (endonuclease V)